MLGFPSRKAEGFAAKATDLESLRTAVVDAAGVGYGLWFSYLFALVYFAIAAGAVTHRDLLLESPVKLPFLNVELPLKAFFILGPLVFLVVHAYVLLHFVLLAGKVGAFHAELQKQIDDDNQRAQLRRQLPSNIFVQFLGGPREVRDGIVGFLLKSVAGVSLVAGPIALLVLFQLQFLPHHDPWITWWQRLAVVVDLVLLWLLWLLWPPIARGETALLTWSELGRPRAAIWLPVSLLPVLLVFAVATFPGEWLEEALPEVRIIPTQWPSWDSAEQGTETGQSDGKRSSDFSNLFGRAVEVWRSMGWTSPHKLLAAGEVDYVTRRPQSLWSNVLVLPNFEIGEASKPDAETKPTLSPKAVSLRGRRLEGAIFVDAHLRNGDFTGAQLARANFIRADLREAKFTCAQAGNDHKCGHLEGAVLHYADLRGADFTGTQLAGAKFEFTDMRGANFACHEAEEDVKCAQLLSADLRHAQLQGALLDGADLRGASLDSAQLQGASLDDAELEVADLNNAKLQGASFRFAELLGAALYGAQLQGASLADVFVWRTEPRAPVEEYLKGALVETPTPEPIYRRLDCANEFCGWQDASYAALKADIETAPDNLARRGALLRIEQLGQKPYEEDPVSAKAWRDLAAKSKLSAEAYPGELAKQLIGIGCAANGPPYVVGGLTEQLYDRLGGNPAQLAEVARAFLDEADCPGAKGLSAENKSKLQQMRGPESPLPAD
jgi:uncharacterized protein YjbI with pentapeptide repeats